MKKIIFLLSVFLAFFMQPVLSADGVYMDKSAIFSDQNVRVSTLSSDEMQRTQGAFFSVADFSSIINSQTATATATSSGLFAISAAFSNSIAVNTAINAPITINVGQWLGFSH